MNHSQSSQYDCQQSCQYHNLSLERLERLLSQGKQLRDLLKVSGVMQGCGTCLEIISGLKLTGLAPQGRSTSKTDTESFDWPEPDEWADLRADRRTRKRESVKVKKGGK